MNEYIDTDKRRPIIRPSGVVWLAMWSHTQYHGTLSYHRRIDDHAIHLHKMHNRKQCGWNRPTTQTTSNYTHLSLVFSFAHRCWVLSFWVPPTPGQVHIALIKPLVALISICMCVRCWCALIDALIYNHTSARVHRWHRRNGSSAHHTITLTQLVERERERSRNKKCSSNKRPHKRMLNYYNVAG